MNQKKLLIQTFILILALALLAVPVYADEGVQATLTAAQTELAVGDPVQLTLQVVHPAGTQVIIPKLEQTWGPYEVRDQSRVKTVTNPDGTQTTSQIIRTTAKRVPSRSSWNTILITRISLAP